MENQITVKSEYCLCADAAFKSAVKIYLAEGACRDDEIQVGFNCRQEDEKDAEYQCVLSNYSDLMSEADRWMQGTLKDMLEEVDGIEVEVYYDSYGKSSITLI